MKFRTSRSDLLQMVRYAERRRRFGWGRRSASLTSSRPGTSCRRARLRRAGPAVAGSCRRMSVACPAPAAWASVWSPPSSHLRWKRRTPVSCITLVYHWAEVIHVPLVRSHRKCPIDSPAQPARTCSSTLRIRWIGGSGDLRRSPRRSAVMHQFCSRWGYAACHWCHVVLARMAAGRRLGMASI
jgi:hypothetical protein